MREEGSNSVKLDHYFFLKRTRSVSSLLFFVLMLLKVSLILISVCIKQDLLPHQSCLAEFESETCLVSILAK
jgi:hypothetical protein